MKSVSVSVPVLVLVLMWEWELVLAKEGIVRLRNGRGRRRKGHEGQRSSP